MAVCRYALMILLVLGAGLGLGCAPAMAQESVPAETSQPAPKLPDIADEPVTIDPATLVPAPLAAPATVDLSTSSLREVVEWLQNERKIPVLLEQKSLDDEGIALGEPLSERLDDAPVYLLLNRLRSLGLAWTFEDGILHITSRTQADERLVTVPYNIGDLRDAGYQLDDLESVVQMVAPESWEVQGGLGVLNFLGDVMFVRQTDEHQREVRGLLEALRTPARRTYAYYPPQNLALRAKLAASASIQFRDTPLEAAVDRLAEQAGMDIRLDHAALREAGIRERQPVTLKLENQKLETILEALGVSLGVTWMLRDGVLWITDSDQERQNLLTAVYDVRDLCRDEKESASLREALLSQAAPDVWVDMGGSSELEFARPGILVIHAGERTHIQVLGLLESYRTALRQSRPRYRDAQDPNEVITVYYRMNADVAKDLQELLPRLVLPETWKRPDHPEAPGEILRASSNPEVLSVPAKSRSDAATAPTFLESRAVLIVRHTRATHEKIADIVRRVEQGDAQEHLETFHGGGLGGGGFGGGFF